MIGQLIKFIEELGFGSSIDKDSETVEVYHGTSKGSCTLINKRGRIKNYAFFTLDKETATRFGYAAITRGTPTIMPMRVSLHDVFITGGYLTSRTESLYLGDDGIWRSCKTKGAGQC